MSQTKAQLLDPKGDVTYSGHITGVGATFNGNIRAVDGVFSGNVSIAGTLTKQDVTNVDSVGIVTARSGVNVTGGNVFIGQGGSGANNAELKLQAGAGTGNDIIAFLNQAGTTKGNITYDTDNNFLMFNVNQGEKLRITTTGQLELSKDQDGVTGRPTNRIVFKDTDSSVAANQPIGEISWYSSDAGMTNVNSWIRGINEHTNGNGALLFGVKAAGSSEIEALRITSTGTVGIGSDIPAGKLDISHDTQTNLLVLKRNSGNSGTFTVAIGGADPGIEMASSGVSADFVFKPGGTERLRIDDSGNITAVNTAAGQSVTLKVGASNASGVNDGVIRIVNGGTGNGVIQWDYEGNANRAQIYVYRSEQELRFTTAGTQRLSINSSGTATFTGAVLDYKGNVRSVPLNTQASTYTLIATDAGKAILASNTITISDGVFGSGDVVTIINNTNGDIAINKGSVLYNTADGTNGNRTLATRGIATIYFTHNTTGYISGTGLS